MRERILGKLKSIEAEYDVRVLFACESGSRAWGFASTDSDYDVRFLYVRKVESYLSLSPPRDVIELPIVDELDVSGWDLQKGLKLLVKSNPPLLEWIASPIIYLAAEPFTSRLRRLRDLHFSPKSCLYHYLQMARGNYREYLKRDMVKLKKYLYVLRPILACGWIEQHGTMAPTEFAKLVQSQVTDAAVREAIDDLLTRKAAGTELGEAPMVPVLNEFCDRELQHLEQVAADSTPGDKPGMGEVDLLFRDALAAS